ncbi:phenylacetic acid degradation operon negative regulatory protein [Nakamurella sp. UYEF19]|uniref:PaaX family transcriptional regulator n=1 Tax=Nakamurella sp. UYEF19 TaxID=1756392 RepID=UPI003399C386
MIKAEEPTAGPGSLILTFAGLYLRGAGGWIAVADLITLLGRADQSPTAVRQALVRLKSRDVLRSEKRGARSGYALTTAGEADLLIGDARIFRYGEASDSDGWVLAVFSVPEEARAERHRLRELLSWWGFGTVGAGVRIAPATLADRTRAAVLDAGLSDYVTWFAARALDRADVATWWDLALLSGLYRDFLARWESRPTAVEDRRAATAFAQYLMLVDDWRQFPRIDPGLPAALLPEAWPSRRAFDTFSTLRDRWSGPALDFVTQMLSG